MSVIFLVANRRFIIITGYLLLLPLRICRCCYSPRPVVQLVANSTRYNTIVNVDFSREGNCQCQLSRNDSVSEVSDDKELATDYLLLAVPQPIVNIILIIVIIVAVASITVA